MLFSTPLGDKNLNLNEQLKDILGPAFQISENDWEYTIKNLMALAREANRAFEYDKAITLLVSLERIWDSKGLPDFSLDMRVQLHQEKGKAYTSIGSYDEAITEFKKILDYCHDSRNLNLRSETFTQIGQLLAKQGDHERALGYLQRAIGAYRRAQNKTGLCKALRNLGVVYCELGEFEEAETVYIEAMAIAGTAGNKVLYADLVNNLGAIMNMKGKRERALELYNESLEIYLENSEIRKAAYTKNNIAITLTEREMNEQAYDYFQQAYEIACKIGDASLKLIVDINLADLYLKRKEFDRARKHSKQAEKYLTRSNLINVNLVEARKINGKIAYCESNLDLALREFESALEISREIGSKYHEADVLVERGKLMRLKEKHLDALADLEASYQIYRNIKAEGKRAQTQQVINSIERLYLEVFNSMGKRVDRKDSYTKGHSDRVASLSLLLAKELGLRTSVIKTVVAAALLHDIGKVKVSDIVLNKPGRLTDEEFEEIKMHPEFGVEMLRGKEFPWDLKPLILHHHERYDGSGYPMGIQGEDIPLGARIICIADVFEALTSDRVYRKSYDVRKAIAIMKSECGSTFDAVLLKSFIKLIENGDAERVINADTGKDELFSIWSQCMETDGNIANQERDFAAC